MVLWAEASGGGMGRLIRYKKSIFSIIFFDDTINMYIYFYFFEYLKNLKNILWNFYY